MEKIELRGRNPIKRDENIWTVIIHLIIYTAAGTALFFILSLLSYALFQPGIGNVTFRPATAILPLFGVLYGPWVGLFAGIFGKTFSDAAAGWGFYWNGSLAYGLIGFIPGFVKMSIKDLRSARNTLKAVLISVLGVLAGASFFSLTEAYFSDVNLGTALGNFFWPEFAGNLVVVMILLPLLIVAVAAIGQKGNK